MLRIVTMVLFGLSLTLVHESVAVPRRGVGSQNLSFKVADADALPEKMRRYLGPSTKGIKLKTGDPKWLTTLPTVFDLREAYPECADQLSQVQDEGPCDTDSPGVVTSLLSDKLCILSGGEKKYQFSADFLLRCAEHCKQTAYIAMSWIWAWDYGVPTGGDYDSDVGCQPYSYKPCKHTLSKYVAKEKKVFGNEVDSDLKGGLKECQEAYINVKQNKCTSRCTNSNYDKKTTTNDTIRFEDWYFLPENDAVAIKKEILARGPVAAAFTLYEDFFKYKGGIYTVTKGAREVATWKHVKLIGWGEENGKKYWLAVNTWSDLNKGDKVVKIGIKEASIQEYVTSGHLHEHLEPDD